MPDAAPPPNIFKIGLVFIVSGALLCLLPLVLGHWDFNKYIVTIGVIGILLGLNFCLHGALDRWKNR
jgi:uncharacterized membrane protein HdeD (DUF308 family)